MILYVDTAAMFVRLKYVHILLICVQTLIGYANKNMQACFEVDRQK